MSPAAAPWIPALVILAAALFAPQVLNDGDTFSHIATGHWILAHRAIPTTDPFSHSFAGAPWVAHEWLAEVMLALADAAAGWSGTVALTVAAAALAFFNLARHLGRFLPPGPTLLLVLLAAASVAPGMLVRPHILALPAFEAWIAGLLIACAAGRAPPWRLLPLMCLWANLHGGFILGLLLVPPLALEAALAEPARARQTLTRWGAFLAAATLAALLTPHGLTGLLFPFQLAAMPELSGIGEWRPTDFGTLQPLEIILLAGTYVALTRGARLPPIRLLLTLGLLHLALTHTRHQALFGLIVPLLIAEPLGRAIAPPAPRPAGRWHMIALTCAALLLTTRLALPITRTDGPTAPIAAIAALPADLAGQNVLNDYAFGGYLIFAGIPPFIDGRADMYGPAFLRRYAAIIHPNRDTLDDTIRHYHIGWTLLSPANPAVDLLDLLPGWCRRYTDPTAVIHAPCAK